MASDAFPSPEQAAECDYINDYCRRRHHSVVTCHWTRDKGRVLRSGRAFEPGEILFREPPLHLVAERPEHPLYQRVQQLAKARPADFVFEPLWYWAALSSLPPSCVPAASQLTPVEEDTHKKLLLLYSMQVDKPGDACTILAEELRSELRCDPLDLEKLLQVWILNCFEHSDEPLGYSTYFMSSFMSHSCRPNAVWHYDGDDFILRAREALQVGEEVTVSYLAEEALLESTVARRRHLQDSKHFVCCCPRCASGCDPCRGFRCPSCSSVSLKFGAPKGDQVEVKATAMHRRRCEHCLHELDFGQAAVLEAEETLLQKRLDTTEQTLQEHGLASPDRELLQRLERSLRRAEASLAQHYLLDRAAQLLSDLSERLRQWEDAERMMRKRLEYQATAYPGLSGSTAWIYEAYADMLLRHAQCAVDPVVEVPDSAAALRVLRSVPAVYASCLDILRTMFGEEHEFYKGVHRKSRELKLQLERHLGEACR